MSATALTVHLPEPLYARLAERAKQADRPVEEEVVDTLESAISERNGFRKDAAETVDGLELLSDHDLWNAARSRLSAEAAERLEDLNFQVQRGKVSVADRNEIEGLKNQYEKALLVRARAIEMLMKRGHDVSGLLTP